MIEIWSAMAPSDRIASSALVVSMLALLIAAFAARYSRAQAIAATRGDLRVQIDEIDRALADAEGIRSVIANDIATVRACKDAFFARGHLPGHQRPPPPYSTSIASMARGYLGRGEFATVRLEKDEENFLEEIVAVDDVLLRDLLYIYEGTASGSAEGQEDSMDLAIEKLIAELRGFDSRVKALLGRVRSVLKARRDKLQRKLR